MAETFHIPGRHFHKICSNNAAFKRHSSVPLFLSTEEQSSSEESRQLSFQKAGNGDLERQREALYSGCDAGLGRGRGSNRVSRIIPMQRCCGQLPKRAFENSDSGGRGLERESALLLSSLFQLLVLFLGQLQVYPTTSDLDTLIE
jgi:hypothetical protein